MHSETVPIEAMDEATRRLFEAARGVQANAHVPYSRYPVGCALISSSGTLYVGANIENAAYPQGWCAEASAIAAMASSRGARDRRAVDHLRLRVARHLLWRLPPEDPRVRDPGDPCSRLWPRRTAGDVSDG